MPFWWPLIVLASAYVICKFLLILIPPNVPSIEVDASDVLAHGKDTEENSFIYLMRNAAETLTPVTLELGGKDAFIICEDVDVSHVAQVAVRGTLQSSGQNCAGAERFYVHCAGTLHPSISFDLSQLGPQNHEPNIHERDSASIELGESEAYIPSQWSEATSEARAEGNDRRSRRKWTPIEDVVLISVWLNTSKDPIIGNEQKAEAFWKRIAAYFAASPLLVGMQKREPSHCKQRWAKINDMVCKFVGCYEAASSQKSSGQNDNDVMKLVHQIYFNDHKQKFNLEHAWRELRHDQKWCQKEGTVLAKRRKIEVGSTQSSTSVPDNNEDDQVRPPGVKASKAKSKKAGNKATEQGTTLLEFQNIWEIKQKDLAMKERLSKQKLLDSLLAKTEPLF